MHTHAYICICTRICMCMYMHAYADLLRELLFLLSNTHACAYITDMCIYLHISTCICIHTAVQHGAGAVHIHVCMHICT